MRLDLLIKGLRYGHIIDCAPANISADIQARNALHAGATLIRYATHAFTERHFQELLDIRNHCRTNHVLLLIEDDPVLARLHEQATVAARARVEALMAADSGPRRTPGR